MTSPGLEELRARYCRCEPRDPDDQCPIHGYQAWRHSNRGLGRHVRRLGDFLHRLFLRPLDPPAEHEVDCPHCGGTFFVDCED